MGAFFYVGSIAVPIKGLYSFQTMTYIFYNPLSNNKKGKRDLVKITELLNAKEVSFFDVTKEENIARLLLDLSSDDIAVIAGGDGTLHRFVNSIYGDSQTLPNIRAKLFYYPAGSGNDFMHDVTNSKEKELIELKQYIENLPSVTINGKTSHFINGIGVGIDGWCCAEALKQLKTKSDKPINYTALALKGLFYAYKPVGATVVVDGILHRYKGMWLAPAMNGRYFGGGMKVAPNQDRLNKEHTVSFIAAHDISRLRAFTFFPEFLSGKYIRHTQNVDVIPAKEITVTFDKPVSLQIDGEAFLNIASYSVKC